MQTEFKRPQIQFNLILSTIVSAIRAADEVLSFE